MGNAFLIDGMDKTAQEINMEIESLLNWYASEYVPAIHGDIKSIKVFKSTVDVLLNVEPAFCVSIDADDEDCPGMVIHVAAHDNYEAIFGFDCDDWVDRKELDYTKYPSDTINKLEWRIDVSFT